MSPSVGQRLYHELSLCQGSYFRASVISEEMRKAWTNSFARDGYRNKLSKVNEKSLFVVLSQNCDITCHKDENEPCIELVVCKEIKEEKVFPGNLFVKSVRRLHLKEQDQWYEANVDYIVTVKKDDLLEILTKEDVSRLSKEYAQAVPVWRANRYQRTALPDSFNDVTMPVLEEHLPNIQEAAYAPDEGFSSYIRAIYIWLDSLEEEENYKFEFFALMHESTSDEVLSQTQDAIEAMVEDMVSKTGFEDSSDMYADRDSNTYVSYLTRFVRINLDHVSLSEGDDDMEPE